ncbi:MAG: VanZ family protein [bacterium]
MKEKTKVLLLIFWIIVIFVLTGYPKLKVPTIEYIGLDKLFHFAIFFILGILEYRLLKTWFFFAIGCSVAFLAEFQQIFIPGRGFELLDIGFGLLGLLFSYVIFHRRSAIRNAISKT